MRSLLRCALPTAPLRGVQSHPKALWLQPGPTSLKGSVMVTGQVHSGQQGRSGHWGPWAYLPAHVPAALSPPGLRPTNTLSCTFGSILPCLDPNHPPHAPRRGSRSLVLAAPAAVPDEDPVPETPDPQPRLRGPLSTFPDRLPLGHRVAWAQTPGNQGSPSPLHTSVAAHGSPVSLSPPPRHA